MVKNKIIISAIRYANSYPLNYGLRVSGIEEYATIEIDHPAECARRLTTGEADIGLVPVAAIPDITGSTIISDYCIGTNSPVRTVLLVSNRELKNIESINLDYRSGTSVALAKILAARLWKKEFEWKETSYGFDFENIPDNEGLVIIGDQCFELETKYRYTIDLATEWKKLTGLPFVFACWVSNRQLPEEFLHKFNKALHFGISNIDSAVKKYGEISPMSVEVLKSYLVHNIDYQLNKEKHKAMNIFFDYLKEI